MCLQDTRLSNLQCQGSKLTLVNSQNASDFDNLRVRKISTSKRLRVRILHVSQTKGNNLLVVSPVCQWEKILLAKLCKCTKKITSSPECPECLHVYVSVHVYGLVIWILLFALGAGLPIKDVLLFLTGSPHMPGRITVKFSTNIKDKLPDPNTCSREVVLPISHSTYEEFMRSFDSVIKIQGKGYGRAWKLIQMLCLGRNLRRYHKNYDTL